MKAKIDLIEGSSLRRLSGRLYKKDQPVISTNPEEIAYCENSTVFRVTMLGRTAAMQERSKKEQNKKKVARKEIPMPPPARAASTSSSEPSPPPASKPSRPARTSRTKRVKAKVAHTEED